MKTIILVEPIVGLLDNIKTAPGLPLSLLSAAKLVSREYKVKIIDQRLDEDWRYTLQKELKKKPLFVGTTAMLGPQVEYARYVGEEVKKYSDDIPVVWGGPHGSVLQVQTISDPTVDILVEGDGEETMLKIARVLDKGTSLARVAGIYFKKDGEIVYTGPAKMIDLNKMPDIPYHLVNVADYLPRRGNVKTLDMETSRGCPFRCRFCYNPYFNRGMWRALRADIVLKRVRDVVSKYNIKGIWFIDDEFFIDLDRAKKIIEGINKMGLKWTIQGVTAKSILRMDEAFLRFLEEAGCEQLNVGAESGSDRILKMVNKGITTKTILEVNKKLVPFNIMPWFYFMIGFPYETKADAEKTVNLILRLLSENPKTKVSGVGCFTPYPGTSLFEDALKLGFKPPQSLSEWKTFSVDQINVPWIKGEKKRMVEAVQFTSFFIDDKARDVTFNPFIRAAAMLYRPLARYRLQNKYWGIPIDIILGNEIKRHLAKHRNIL